jgi:ribose transport system ATP-binding protein
VSEEGSAEAGRSPATAPDGVKDGVDGGPLLVMEGITKRFPGVVALRDVSFDLYAGEVHVLFGENGAGKSTLINVIAGTYPADGGTMVFEGEEISHLSPQDARRRGINAVFQDFSLVPQLSVEENLYLGREPGPLGFVDRKERAAGAQAALDVVKPFFSIKTRVDGLSRSAQQLVEIAKALMGDPQVLILDEPTTSLTEQETELLFNLIDELKANGLAIVYITHRMREIPRVGDRITVLRDGNKVATLRVGETDDNRLIQLMTGRTLESLYPRAAYAPADTRLRLERVSGQFLHDVSLDVCAGEVVGVAGLVGSGKSEIGRICFGLAPHTGVIELGGRVVDHREDPQDILGRGLIYHPADRRGEGLMLTRPVRENLTFAALDRPDFSHFGFLHRAQERRKAAEIIKRLRIQPPQPERRVAYLSGGNQQKVVLGKALTRDVGIHIFDEPTAGVDVGARVEVYEFIKELCETGSAILLISSDLPEVLHLSHRVYVIHRGRVRAELKGDEITEERVLSNFFDTQADIQEEIERAAEAV